MVPPPRVLVVAPGWWKDEPQLWNTGPIAQDKLMNIRGFENSLLNEYHMG